LSNGISKRGLVRDDGRKGHAVAPPPSFPTCSSLAIAFGIEISETLIAYQLTAYGVSCTD
jgi:hypothetical protein